MTDDEKRRNLFSYYWSINRIVDLKFLEAYPVAQEAMRRNEINLIWFGSEYTNEYT